MPDKKTFNTNWDDEPFVPADRSATIVEGATTDVGVQIPKDDPEYVGPRSPFEKVWDIGKQVAVEAGVPMGVSVATTPLLGGGPIGIASYIGINASAGWTGNLLAQDMRIASGDAKDRSYGEAVSAALWNLIPGIGAKRIANLSKYKKVALRGGEGALIAGGEATTRQVLEIASGDREEFDGFESGFAMLFGSAFGGTLGRIEAGKNWNTLGVSASDARKIKAQVVKDGKKYVSDLNKQIKKATDPKVKANLQGELDEVQNHLSTLEKNDREFLKQLREEADKGTEEAKATLNDVIDELEGRPAGTGAETDYVTAPKTEGETPSPSTPKRKPVKLTKKQRSEILERSGMSDEDLLELTDAALYSAKTGKKVTKTSVLTMNLDAFTEDVDVKKFMAAMLEQIRDQVKAGRIKMTKKNWIKMATERRKLMDPDLDEAAFAREVANESEDLIIKAAVSDALTFHQAKNWTDRMQKADLTDPTAVSDLYVDLDRMGSMMESSSRIGSASGSLLQSRKNARELIQLQVAEQTKKARSKLKTQEADLMLSYSKDMSPGELKEQLERLGGMKHVQAYLGELALINDPARFLKNVQARQKRGVFGKIVDLSEEYRYASMLSNPATQGAAAFGNFWQGAILPFNQLVGAVASRDWKTARHAARTYKYLWSSIPDAFKAANKAATNSKGEMSLRTHYEKLGERAYAMEATEMFNPAGEALENLGELVTFGPKGLVWQDEFYRHMFGKAQAKALIAEEHAELVRKGLSKPSDLADYTEGKLTRYFVDNKKFVTSDEVNLEGVRQARAAGLNGEEAVEFIKKYHKENWTDKLSSELEYLRDFGDQVTYQRQLSAKEGGSFEMLAAKVDEARRHDSFGGFAARWTIPFIRTPVNIATDVGGTMPGAFALGKRMRRDVVSDNPLTAAQARGKQLVGAGLWGSALWLAYNKVITPAGPQDWQERERKKETGWQPNALNLTALHRLRVDGHNDGDQPGDVYYSLERLDPLASILQLASTTHRMDEDNDVPEDFLESASSRIAYAVSSVVTSRSYMETVGSSLGALTDGRFDFDSVGEKVSEAIVRGYTPSILNSLGRSEDPYLREVNGPIEQLYNRLGLSRGNLEPKRDVFGKKRRSASSRLRQEINPFVPTKGSVSTYDKARNIIAEVRGRYEFPRPNSLFKGIDLRDIKNPETNQSAYDRWKEIYATIEGKGAFAGKNVAEAVVSAYENPLEALSGDALKDLQEIPLGNPLTDLRKKVINKVLNGYREMALARLIKDEYPELMEQYKVKGDLMKKYIQGEELPKGPVIAPEVQELLER